MGRMEMQYKLLFEQTGKPDNWTDEFFLKRLKKNLNVQRYNYWDLVFKTGLITQHLSCLSVFCSVFYAVYDGKTSSREMLVYLIGILFVLFVSFSIHQPTAYQDIPRVFVFSLILAGLSPILKTLTESTSSDTIWALSTLLFIANCLFHTYNEPR